MNIAEISARATENICTDCGKCFVIRMSDYKSYADRGWDAPKRCPACRQKLQREREARKKAIEDAEWQKQKAEKQKEYEHQLALWNTVSYEEVASDPDRTLCIVGNGFDMMHGVNSGYYNFRDFLGKNSALRRNLEAFITMEDIWADFENALAHIDIQFFSSRMNADNWLYIMGAYEEDAGLAEFYMAAEYAGQVVEDMVKDLQRRFYDWVCKLAVGTEDRPLRHLFDAAVFGESRVLNFNYTEFVEDMYGVSGENICYIHGCRRKQKGVPRPKLILGHAVGASDVEFEKKDHTYADMRSPKKREMIYAAQDIVFEELMECDRELTKDCAQIIGEHEDFFEGIRDIRKIITIGHSLSEVDWPYFAEVISMLNDRDSVRWFFGCHGLRDLENLKEMIRHFGIDSRMITVFRTDVIAVKRNAMPETVVQPQAPKVKVRCVSPDGKWKVQTMGREIQFIDMCADEMKYAVEFPASISSIFFLKDTGKVFLVSNDYPSGIFVWSVRDGAWSLLYELEKDEHYNFLTRSLNRILLDGDKLVFVHNNRVREHSLEDGKMIRSTQFRGAWNRQYPGEDVTDMFRKAKF